MLGGRKCSRFKDMPGGFAGLVGVLPSFSLRLLIRGERNGL